MQDPSQLPKFCPRCGAFYRDLRSTTCPQCFGKLEVMDMRQAQALTDAAEKNGQEQARAKAADDERYKEQAFGGCAALAAIVLLTAVASILIVVAGAHRRLSQPAPAARVSFDQPQSVTPATVAGSARTGLVVSRRSATTTFTTIRAVYGADLQIFAAPADLSPPQRDAFRISTNIVLGANASQLKRDEIVVHGADYIVFGKSVEKVEDAINQLAQ